MPNRATDPIPSTIWTECRRVTGTGFFFVAAALAVLTVGCPPGPTKIKDWHDLNALREDLAGDYVLVNDLDSTTAGYAELAGPTANGGKGWEPIGASDDSFTGDFDGQGNEIRDLCINRPDEDYVGLFACVSWTRHIDNFGRIANLGVVSADVTGGDIVGCLVGHNGGLVANSSSGGTVSAYERVGGLVGWNQRTLLNSFASCTVSGDTAVGGLVGDNWLRATVSNSYSGGNVTGVSKVGGLVGWNYYGVVMQSYAAASVSGDTRAGGLIGGDLGGTVTNSFWDTEMSATLVSGGGIGKTTAQLRSIATYTDTTTEGLDEPWDITAVTSSTADRAYIWNIVEGYAYPFLSWQSAG
ncbi:MAG: hypothetical protein ACLFVD_05460 [Dehalococcoidia bacterium]